MNCSVLGPKLYCALGNQAHRYVTTRLHIDVTDAANILVWAAEPSECAALWHIFSREDNDRLREALWDLGICERGVDPIHSQSIYLREDTVARLQRDYGIRVWVIRQSVGEAIIIPAGCAHQVRPVNMWVLSSSIIPYAHRSGTFKERSRLQVILFRPPIYLGPPVCWESGDAHGW